MEFASLHVGPLIPVSDLAASRAFYEGSLGIEGEEVPGGYLLRCGDGTTIYLLTGTSYAGRAEWPLASFRTDDIVATVEDLRRRGVPLEQISEGPQTTDARGIATVDGTQLAWIRDPDGQVLSIYQRS
jgi:catechol 2,3-dioxygenase-like lactoylglutathione lyase family enzyme